MEWIQWAVTVGVGLISGTVGGVILAPKIRRREELALRRLEAEMTIRDALRRYRDEMKYLHAGVESQQIFPNDYASTTSQQQLAEVVLRRRADLPRRQRARLTRSLTVLIGQWTMTYANERGFVSDDLRTDRSETHLRNKLIGDIHKKGDLKALGRGLLGAVNHNPHDQASYDSAMQLLTDMIADVPIRRELPRSLKEVRARWSHGNGSSADSKGLETGPTT